MNPELLPRLIPGWPSFANITPFRAPPDRQDRPAAQGRRVLIVEDEYFIALELDRWLEEAGHEIVGIAGSAHKAVAEALAHHPDLVIMDIRLAGDGDGIEAAVEIFDKIGVRCLFASAHADARTRNRAAGAEPLGWLAKPYSKADFLAAFEAALAALDVGA